MPAHVSTHRELEHWPATLERVAAEQCTLIKRPIILRETESTQDAARRMRGVIGDAFIAWRQTAGRGRMGKRWHDSGEDGIALTCIIAHATSLPLLAIATAVGVATTVERLLPRQIEIKWPNDVLIDGRKLAGILIEQTADCAYIGIGLNISQHTWPDELATRAVSLHQLSVHIDRLDVLTKLLPALDGAWRMSTNEVQAAFSSRDYLRGKFVQCRCGDEVVSGRVKRIDLEAGLLLDVHGNDRWLDAMRTTIVSIAGDT